MIEARVSGTCTRSHASRWPHAQQPVAAAVAAAIALWGSTRTTVLLPRLPSGGTVLLEPVRCSAGELARRCGAGDFAFRGRMCFSERANAAPPDPVGKRNNLSFADNDEATVFPRRYDKIPQPVKAEVHRTTAMRVLDETSRT